MPCGGASVTGLSLSCSDKLRRWNRLGLEGALLSCLIEQPIRMSSLTVGRKFCRDRCEAAFPDLPVLGTGAQGTRLALRVALTPPPELRKGWGSNHAGNPHAPGGIPVAGGLPPVGSYPLRVVAIELTDATPSGTRNHISPTCNPDTRGSHRADRCDT